MASHSDEQSSSEPSTKKAQILVVAQERHRAGRKRDHYPGHEVVDVSAAHAGVAERPPAAPDPIGRKAHKAEGGRGPLHQFAGQPRQIHRCNGAGRQIFQREISRRNRVHGIAHRPGETKGSRRPFAVDWERGACQRGGAQG